MIQGQLELQLYHEEIDVDGLIDKRSTERAWIQYIGKARRQNNGKYTCLADVNGCLCIVEVTIR